MNNQFDYLEDELEDESVESKNERMIRERRQETEKKIAKSLRTILRKSETELTAEDKSFLKARVHYLNKSQRAEYADILNEQLPTSTGEGSNPQTEEDLMSFTRGELNQKAIEIGMENVEEYPSKGALIEAMKKFQEI